MSSAVSVLRVTLDTLWLIISLHFGESGGSESDGQRRLCAHDGSSMAISAIKVTFVNITSSSEGRGCVLSSKLLHP